MSKSLVRRLVPRRVRNCLRSPAKVAEWLWDAAWFRLSGARDYPVRDGWVVRAAPFAYHNAYQVHVDTEEGRSELDEFIMRCRPGMVLFDVGCHFGIFTLAALHYAGAGARIFAFDPSPMAERELLLSATLNGARGQVVFTRAAVGEGDGEVHLVEHGLFGNGYFGISTISQHDQEERTRTPCRALDSLMCQFGVRPTHLKIDVEGFEWEVLQGARMLFQDVRPVLFLEIHNEILRARGIPPESIFHWLDERQYSSFSSLGRPVDMEALLTTPIARVVCEPG